MADFHREGGDLEYTEPTSGTARSRGDVFVVQDTLVVALQDIALGAKGTVATRGVWRNLPKVAGTAVKQGDALSWDESSSGLTAGAATSSGDLANVACATADAASAATTVEAQLANGSHKAT